MHTSIALIGPGAIALIVLIYAIWGVSLYVFSDSVRRPKRDFTGVIEGRWFYVVPQGLFFVIFLAGQFPQLTIALPWLGYVQIALVPLALAQQIAYLLRVVFPTSKRLEARLRAEEEELAHEYGVESADEGLDGEPFVEPAHDKEDETRS
jgi:hypothetical protein